MKRRIRRITNFFAFNLLFFALYLNFIHKDNGNAPVSSAAAIVKETNQNAAIAKETKKEAVISASVSK